MTQHAVIMIKMHSPCLSTDLLSNILTDIAALDDESLRGSMPVMGRITGSASIETLVRVGIEKENGLAPDSKMVVIHDFMPCVDDELEVKRGQVMISTMSSVMFF